MWAAASKVRSFAPISVRHFFRLLRILLTPFSSRSFFSAGRLAGDLLPPRRAKRAAAAKAQLWRAPARNQAPVQRARLGFFVQPQAQALRGLLQRHVVHRAWRDVPVRRNLASDARERPCGAFLSLLFALALASSALPRLDLSSSCFSRAPRLSLPAPLTPSARLRYTSQPLAEWIWTRQSPPRSFARPSSRATLTLRPNSRARKSLSPQRTERACPCLLSPLAGPCSTAPTRRCSTATEVSKKGRFGGYREIKKERGVFFFFRRHSPPLPPGNDGKIATRSCSFFPENSISRSRDSRSQTPHKRLGRPLEDASWGVAGRNLDSNFWGRWSSLCAGGCLLLFFFSASACLQETSFRLQFSCSSLSFLLPADCLPLPSLSPSPPSFTSSRLQHLPRAFLLRRPHRLRPGLRRRRRRRQPARRRRVRHLLARRRLRPQQAKRL